MISLKNLESFPEKLKRRLTIDLFSSPIFYADDRIFMANSVAVVDRAKTSLLILLLRETATGPLELFLNIFNFQLVLSKHQPNLSTTYLGKVLPPLKNTCFNMLNTIFEG